jgi:hypothetical protein
MAFGLKTMDLAKKLGLLFFGIVALVLLSAFMSHGSSENLSRYELGLMIEGLLAENGVEAGEGQLEVFKDLSEEQNCGLLRTVGMRAMVGFSDGSFRPRQAVRNLEVMASLQKLSSFFHQHDPKARVSMQLMRLFAYRLDPRDALSSSYLGFLPKTFKDSSAITKKEEARAIFAALHKTEPSRHRNVQAVILNAYTGEPVPNAFVVLGSDKVAKADRQGVVNLVLPNEECYLDLFVTQEGYEPLEIRKEISLEGKTAVLLRPGLS